MGSFIVERLDEIVNEYRNNSRFFWDVASDHENHSKLTDGVRKGHDGRSQKPFLAKGQNDTKKRFERRATQRCSNFQGSVS